MDRPRSPTDAGARLLAALRRRLAIDARSLAALRVGLGLVLLADLLLRTRSFEAFYTDAGVLPLADYRAWSDPLHLSLHALSGDAWFQVLLFLLAGGFAVALAVGYRTRAATVGSWVLLVSLHNRNPLVLNGGDVLLRLVLFWAIFLPLAERWSVDARRADWRRSRVASVASAALLLQVVLMYTVNAAFKLGGEIWLAGDGLEYVLSLGQFTTALGEFLAAYPTVLTVLDYLWLVMVAGAFLLIVLTGLPRTVLVGLFVAMHVGMAMTMRLGLFPLISTVALLAFLPAEFWEAATPRLAGTRPAGLARRLLARLDAALPVVTVSNVSPRLRRVSSGLSTVVPLVFLVLVVGWNVQVLGFERGYGPDPMPDAVEPAVELTRTDQYWNMFAPDPLATDGWVVAPGRLEDGSRVDAFGGGDVSWDRPPDVSATYPTARWRKYIVGLWRYDTGNRERFAEYLCGRWNANHDAALDDVTVIYVEQPTRIDGGPEPTERVELAEWDCPPAG